MTPSLARLTALGGFRRWDRAVKRFITDPRLHRIFTFQALYAGVPPQRALAVYAVIAYMDTVAGVYFPRGGMRALPDAIGRRCGRRRGRVPLWRNGNQAGAAAETGSAPCTPTPMIASKPTP